jgi:hypothetical protein
MAKKYAVSCVDHETDIMNIDFRNTTQIARIENNSVSTTNVDRAAIEGGEGGVPISNLICCKWWRESDNTWTCLQRWDHAIVEPFPEG